MAPPHWEDQDNHACPYDLASKVTADWTKLVPSGGHQHLSASVLAKMVGRTERDPSHSLLEIGLGEDFHASLIFHPFHLRLWLWNWIRVWFSCVSLGKLMSFPEL